jgi:ribosome-associated protein
MTIDELLYRGILNYLVYSATRSSGAGGQNVNKVNTRVEVRMNIIETDFFTEEELKMIKLRLASKLTLEGELIVVSQTERTQLRNKEQATERFLELLVFALTPKVKRKKTKPTKGSIEKRLKAKTLLKEKKQRRKEDYY